MNLIANQTKYGWIKAVNFTIDQLNHDEEKNEVEMYSMHHEGNLLLLKDFLKPERIKFINTFLQYRKLCMLIN